MGHQPARLGRRGLLVAAGGLALGCAGALGRAEALSAPAEVIGTPDPVDLAHATPHVQPITASSQPIRVRVEDTDKLATETTSDDGYDARLHAAVAFAKDSATLLPAATARLQQIATALQSRGPGRVTITGYTDDLGTAEHGLTLSRQRADAVQRVLKAALPATYQFTATGKGEADPVVPNTSESNRAQNRRVEIHYEKG